MSHPNEEPQSAGPTLSQSPPLRSLAYDSSAVGNIQSSVNQFRGTVSLPIDLLTLPGKEGLDVKASILYSSAIRSTIENWNVDAPTGILGLGWNMPYELIVVEKNGSGSETSDIYYLIAGGAASPMVKTGDIGNKWRFELRNYEFWDIMFDPAQRVWTITKENGYVHTYGGDNAAIQWGVKWGNWIGDSSERGGQQQYPLAWNLTSVRSPWDESVTYAYRNIMAAVGQAGLQYTQASYLDTVTDSFGRKLTFNYGQKYGALNPSPKGIIEYQARNANPPAPNAYQDKYQTLYLDHLDVTDSTGSFLYRYRFHYDFVNFTNTGNPSYPLFWKRELLSVFREGPNGEVLPSLNFEYNTANETNPGALKNITYPDGAIARYSYKKTSIQSSKSVSVAKPLPGSTPGVWQGVNYVAFTYCGASSGFKVAVYSWDGQWVNKDITAPQMTGVQADPDSVLVMAAESYLAVSFRNKLQNRDELYIYRKDSLSFGGWSLYNQQPIYLALKPGKTTTTNFAAGIDFIIAYNPDYAGNAFQNFCYDWKKGLWSSPGNLPQNADPNATGVVIAGTQNYFIVATYFQANRQAKFQIYYRDLGGAWLSANPWTTSNLDVLVDNGQLLFAWTPQPTYAVATYATGRGSDTLNYTLAVYQWDENFSVRNATQPATAKITSPIVNGQSQYKVFLTIAGEAFVNNNICNLRNIGGDINSGTSINWLQKSFNIPPSSASLNFAAGTDIALMCSADQGKQTNNALVFNPNNPNSAGWSTLPNLSQNGTYPTVSADYFTVGDQIYFKGTNGQWKPLPTRLTNLGEQASVQNRAPNYIAYQNNTGSSAQSYVSFVRNGQASQAQPLPGGAQKIYIPAGRAGSRFNGNLAGAQFLVSYPSSAESFSQAAAFTLYNLGEQNLDEYVFDYPVAYVQIDNPYDTSNSFVQSFFYANSDQSRIAYNSVTGIAQYPLVQVVPGLKANGEVPPPSQPQGRSNFYYSNGLSPQSVYTHAQSWIYNYQNVLNGILLAQEDFDSNGSLVLSQTNYWQVYTRNAATGDNLFGAYTRLERTTTVADGVSQDTTNAYDRITGVQLSQDQTYNDAQGNAKVLRNEIRYGWQEPAYKDVFLGKHIYTAAVQNTKSVWMDGALVAYTESQATTYRNWATEGSGIACDDPLPCKPGAYQTYQWQTPGVNPPVFDFSATAVRPGWLKTLEITSRTPANVRPADSIGVVTEQRDVNGVPISFLYDRDQRYAIAAFPNGSIAGDEVSYVGFEAYEADSGWTFGAGASIVPNPTTTTVDAHTGSRSLQLAPNTLGPAGLTRIFRPARQNQPYIFSAWVKKPDGFDAGQGEASWLIAVNGKTQITVAFPSQVGVWVYVHQVIEPPAGADGLITSVAITGQNANSRHSVLIDDVRFSPFSCLFEAVVYASDYWIAIAHLGANGEVSRTAYDVFQQPILETNAADRLEKITSGYFSRSGNQGAFATADPNHRLTLKAAAGGSLVDFMRGSEWQTVWAPQPEVWEVVSGELRQTSPDQAGQLTLADPAFRSHYAVSADFVPLQPATQALGLRIGSNFVVRWNPSTVQWELVDGEGGDLAPPVSVTLFDVPAIPYAAELDNRVISGGLQNLFNAAGYPLPTGSTVASGSSDDGRWVLAGPGGKYFYHLLQRDQTLGVHQVGGSWAVWVDASRFVFWVNGRQIFNYGASQDFAEVFQLYFGTRVAISQLASGLAPQAGVSFTDPRAIAIQAQAWVDGHALVSQIVPDSHGRQAVHTKSAFVPVTDNPPLAYCANFARLDWTTGLMTGLVSDAYPKDGGYPYSREVYEASPQGRVIEQGMPGADFRAGAHSTRIGYGATNGQHGFATNQYHQTTIVNPNGDTYYEISNQLSQVISKISANGGTYLQNMTLFDDAGNPWELRSPNYYAPPLGSTPDNWKTVQTFDYAGRTSSVTPGDQGPGAVTRYIYDRAGNLRFTQGPQGAQDGNYTYRKYNALNQLVEEGYIAGTWNTEQLQDKADLEPQWPPTPSTWRKQYTYDGDQSTPHSIGRLHQVLCNNADSGAVDVIETYGYSVSGQTTALSLVANGFDPTGESRVDYEYDNLGNTIQITYPTTPDGKRFVVRYHLNQLNQVTAIFGPESASTPIVSYRYGPNGQIDSQQLGLGGGQAVGLDLAYNSPLWVDHINAKNPAGQSLFSESLRYTEGGFNNVGYYDGMIAAASYQSGGDSPRGEEWKYSADAIGQIENAQNTGNPDWDLGVSKPVDYDPNGNSILAPQGGVDWGYVYFPGSQRLQRIQQDGTPDTLAEFGYNRNGNATSYNTAGSHQLALNYDPCTQMTRRIVDNSAGGATLTFTYGGGNQRILKLISRPAGAQDRKLYVRGINPYPLCELTTSDNPVNAIPVLYIYGPGGLVAMRKGDALFGIIKDHLGSVRAVVDAQARIVANYDYLTFGALAHASEPEPGFMPYLFTGQEYDREVGLYNYRSRFYAARIGRFIAVDPKRQYFSPYLYCGNNPVLLIDPTGNLATWARILLGVGLVIVAVGVVVLTIATAGSIAPAVAAAVAPTATAVAGVFGASAATAASVGSAVGTVAGTAAAIGYSAALGAVSGGARGGGVYSLKTSDEAFSWNDFGQQVALGAITGAIAGGVAQGLSIAGQGIATAITGLTEEAAANVATQGWAQFGKFVARNAGIGLASSGIASTTSTGVGNAISNVWGQTHMDPGDMATSILLGGLAFGAAKGAGGGVGSATYGTLKSAFTQLGQMLLVI